MAVHIRELVGLVVDENEHGVFGTKKRSKAITEGHQDFLSLPAATAMDSRGGMRQRATLPGRNLLFLWEME
ncbi:hypothetical protein ACFSKM_11950 [Ancylobacter dichloromethanicus]